MTMNVVFDFAAVLFAGRPAELLAQYFSENSRNAACAQGWGGIHFVSAQQLQTRLDHLINP